MKPQLYQPLPKKVNILHSPSNKLWSLFQSVNILHWAPCYKMDKTRAVYTYVLVNTIPINVSLIRSICHDSNPVLIFMLMTIAENVYLSWVKVKHMSSAYFPVCFDLIQSLVLGVGVFFWRLVVSNFLLPMGRLFLDMFLCLIQESKMDQWEIFILCAPEHL